MQLSDFAAHNRTSERPKRGVEEALGDEGNSDLLQQQMYAAGPSMAASSSSYHPIHHHHQPQYAIAYSSTMQVPSTTIPYIPGSEWWPQLIGPAAGQSLPQPQPGYGYPPATMGPQLSGLPQSLFTFDQDQLSSDFMQGLPEDDPSMPSTHFPHSHARRQ